jgi:osmotically-inducible protein OsmY
MADDRPRSHDEPDVYLAEQVRQALIVDPRANELNVQVTVSGGRVFLHGTVATPERREAIAAVAREMLPDHEIHNQTKVGAYPEPVASEAEHLS